MLFRSKCCLNFEVDTYVESARHLPGREIRLETADNTYFHFKTDIFKKEITYSTDKQIAANLVTISAARAFEVIDMNRRGEKPLQLQADDAEKSSAKAKPIDLASQDDLTRFDKAKKKKRKKKSGGGNGQKQEGQQQKPQAENQDAPKAPKNAGEQPQKQQRRRNDNPEANAATQQPGQQKNQRQRNKDNRREPKAQQPRQQNAPQAEKSSDAPQAERPNRIPKAFRDNQE